MSRTAVKAALVLAVATDTTLKAVEEADVPIVAQKLPAAAVTFAGDRKEASGQGRDSKVFRFIVRLYVRVGKDLRDAEGELLRLTDSLDTNLATYRQLTAEAEVIGSIEGTVDGGKFGDGPDLLVYETTVEVKQEAPEDATLYASGATVTLRDVQVESYPLQPPALEVLPDSDGVLQAYVSENAPETRRVTGRVETVAEAAQLGAWLSSGNELAYTDIRGAVSTGWRISGSPVPRVDRRNLSAETFDVEITLWRI